MSKPYSALTAEDSDFLRSLADGSTLSTQAARFVDAIASSSAPLSAALQTAALLGSFDPLVLVPSAKEKDLERLLTRCTVSAIDGRSRWTLTSEARLEQFQGMAATGNLAHGVAGAEQYLQQSGEAMDSLTMALIAIAKGEAPQSQQLTAMSKEGLAAQRAAIRWLEPLAENLGFNADALLGSIELAELLDPFRFLTGFDPSTRTDTFVGRSYELERLRIFVDALRSEGVLESAQRGARRLFGNGRTVLAFSGVGGIGKSTLLSKFILQHLDSADAPPLLFSYLDFDRSTISAAQPVTLVLEMLRQIGWQRADLRPHLDRLRARIREEVERARTVTRNDPPTPDSSRGKRSAPLDIYTVGEAELPSELIGPSLLSTYLHEAGQIVADAQPQIVPLLLVLDTFEEAQALGDPAVKRVELFVDLVNEYIQQARVVVAGRDAVDDYFENAERLVLTEIRDIPSRVAFLEKRGVPKNSASAVARQVGGRPLTLLLAAKLVRERGPDSVTLSLADRLRGIFDKYLIDGVLYQRILEHIKDDDVKKLAHPGLVLRRLDEHLIRQVVAPVLGLGDISEERAQRILTALRLQRDLVRSEPDGSVVHRPDVREQMLSLMHIDQPKLTQELHERAVNYYMRRQVDTADSEQVERDRIEEIYHRISTGNQLAKIPNLWFPRARQGLARFVDEIDNVGGRGTLKVMLSRSLTSEEEGALPQAIKQIFANRALINAVRLPDPDRAIQILTEYSKQLDSELMHSVEPRARDLAGQWNQASRLYAQRVEDSQADVALEEALAISDFFERTTTGQAYRQRANQLLRRKVLEAEIRDRPLLPYVVDLRYRTRRGEHEGRRPAIDGLATAQRRVPRDALDADLQWVLSLSDELERHGARPLEMVPITDTVRGQLVYLASLLRRGARSSDEADIGVRICESMAAGRTIGDSLVERKFSGRGAGVTYTRVLRHLVRPTTPQWYVPIAYLLRHHVATTIRSEDVYLETLPDLPFRVSAVLRTTRSLADYLAQIDHIGILHVCLKRFATLQGPPSDLNAVINAYFEWRRAMLYDIDAWFDSFSSIRLLHGNDVAR